MFRSTFILCTIVLQALSAPNPHICTESCTTYNRGGTSSINGGIHGGIDNQRLVGSTGGVAESKYESEHHRESFTDNQRLVGSTGGVAESKYESEHHRESFTQTKGGNYDDKVEQYRKHNRKNYTAFDGSGDAHLQTVGKTGFGQEPQQVEDLTHKDSQSHSGHYHYDHHHAGKTGFHQETQQTEDLKGQSSDYGNIRVFQELVEPEFSQDTQQVEDVAGHLDFGHSHHQQSEKPESVHYSKTDQGLTQKSAHSDDLSSKNFGGIHGGIDDQRLVDSTGGVAESRYESEHHRESFTQTKGGNYDDKVEQYRKYNRKNYTAIDGSGDAHLEIVGKTEFGQEPQQVEDLTHEHSQSHSGHYHYDHHHAGKTGFHQETQQTEDLKGQSSDNGNIRVFQELVEPEFSQDTQQVEDVAGHLDFGHSHHQQSEKPESVHYSKTDQGLTQKSAHSDDLSSKNFDEIVSTYNLHGKQQFDQTVQQDKVVAGHMDFGPLHQSGKNEFDQYPNQDQYLTQVPARSDDSNSKYSGENVHIHEKTEGTVKVEHKQDSGTYSYIDNSGSRKVYRVINGQIQYETTMSIPDSTISQPTTPNYKYQNSQLDIGDIPNINNSPFDLQPELDLDNHYQPHIPDQPLVHFPNSAGNIGQIHNSPSKNSKKHSHNSPSEESNVSENLNTNWHHHPGDLTNSEDSSKKQISHGIDNMGGRTKSGVKQNPRLPSKQPPRTDPRQRIVEVYGTKGSYNPDHDENIFKNARVNPSATLAPIHYGPDEWLIFEKHFDEAQSPNDQPAPGIPPEVPTTTAAPSFWARLGAGISTTYDKVAQKVKNIFGK